MNYRLIILGMAVIVAAALPIFLLIRELFKKYIKKTLSKNKSKGLPIFIYFDSNSDTLLSTIYPALDFKHGNIHYIGIL